MENHWERFVEINRVNAGEAADIMKKMDNDIRIIDCKLITKGLRNTNYVVNTSAEKFFLRICIDEKLSKNEEIAFRILKEKIMMPKLILAFSHIVKNEKKRIMIYEYIESTTLDEYLEKNGKFSEKILKNIAFLLSELHNIRDFNLKEVNILPNLNECFKMVIENTIFVERIGIDLMNKVNLVLEKYKEEINKKMSKFLIHCDFKSSNLLVTQDEKIYVTDWEYLGYGNRYFDIGLFFRYKNFFTQKDMKIFFDEYNKNAKIKLDENWIEIGTLCNVISLMEMLGRKEEAIKKNTSIKKLIEKEINFLIKK